MYGTFKSDKKCCKYKEILIVFYIGIGKTVWYNVRGLCNIELMGSGKREDNGKEKIGKEKNARVKIMEETGLELIQHPEYLKCQSQFLWS